MPTDTSTTDEWKPIPKEGLNPWVKNYYDFKFKDGTFIIGGFCSDGKYADKYGIPVPRPKYYRLTRFSSYRTE